MAKAKHLRAKIRITGMTCRSCEILLERKIKTVDGVVDVHVDYRRETAIIFAHREALPDGDEIENIIRAAGYNLGDGKAPPQRKWLEIGGSLLLIFALWKLLQAFDIVSLAPSTSGALSFGGMFLIGLVAGASSCLAVTGGLLLALAAKHNEIHQAETPWQKFTPLLHFNIGRLVSYFVLGGLVGLLGQSITLSTKMTGYVNIAVALIMFWLGLSILEIVPKGSFPIRPPKKLSHWVANLSESDHPMAPLLMGAATFFLPCGFTQSLQFVALASGSFLSGALTMFIFALGTLPSLLGISAVSAMVKGTFSRLFLQFSGALVMFLALINIQSGLALTGIDLSQIFPFGERGNMGLVAPAAADGVQEVSMKVTPRGYEPRNIAIKAGIPVRWIVDGSGAQGCTSVLAIPSLNISTPLKNGTNIIEFTASERGQLAFSCSMGMVRGSFTVL